MTWLIPYFPLIAIGGPIAASVLTIVIGRYYRERKALVIYMSETENLMSALYSQFPVVVVRLGGMDVQSLNRATVTAKNTGNVVLKNVTFDIEIEGGHPFKLVSRITEDRKLSEELSTSWKTQGAPDYNPTCRIRLPFLNAGEDFGVSVVFDGDATDIQIYCRMEGVKSRVRAASLKSVDDESLWSSIARKLPAALLGRYF